MSTKAQHAILNFHTSHSTPTAGVNIGGTTYSGTLLSCEQFQGFHGVSPPMRAILVDLTGTTKTFRHSSSRRRWCQKKRRWEKLSQRLGLC
ncbi:hypothetical protein CSING_03675 [Corynebacterium singulare]|uniref:Uncharacterized protein n=1 Tax=Corynebacterium singulare TaxID=161899 RepID=A0A0B6EP39_9CORY|nr:hypothetical protein CSING_03675 [Corynebacterium singulare]